MLDRRKFIRNCATATAGVALAGWSGETVAIAMQAGAGPRRRREVTVGGRRVRTVDIHAHCFLPEIWEMVKHRERANPLDVASVAQVLNLHNVDNRLAQMDERGIDTTALSVHPPTWYWADRDLAAKLINVQNTTLAKVCGAHADR